jgi:hypothetical protein
VFLLSSCAIHKQFPFICFRPGCIKAAFKIEGLKAWKKSRRGKAQIRKNRSNSKNTRKVKSYNINSENNDTTGFGNMSTASCDIIKMVFFRSVKTNHDQTDTFLVHFRQPENEIDELSEVQIRGYLMKNNKAHILKIKLCYCSKEEKQNEFGKGLFLQRTGKIKKFLKEKNILKRKIESE